jgi:iron complex outermembrane receptor protein
MQQKTSRPQQGTTLAQARTSNQGANLNMTRMALAICGITGFCNIAVAQDQAAPVPPQNVVTVTGTSIRGVAAVGSSLNTLKRDDITATGATTATELLRSVPEMNNFSATGNNMGQNQANFVDQPAIHGIGVGNGGAGLTLVLFDGHRLPGAGINQTAPDAAVIPTSALERVEVMADGGSAIYGSDAVAGVINFVPRKNFNGAETNVRFGSASGYQTKNFSQLFGKRWDSGSFVFDYERSQNSALSGFDRSFAANDQRPWGGADTRSTNCTPGTITVGGANYPIVGGKAGAVGASNRCETNRGNDLYPAQHRDQVYASVRQDVSDTVQLYGSFLYSGRKLTQRVSGDGITSGGLSVDVPGTSPFYVPTAGAAGATETVTYNPSADFGPSFQHNITTNTRSFVTGANVELPNNWSAKLELNYGVEKDDVNEHGINQALAKSAALDGTFNPTGIGAATNAGLLGQIGNYVTRYYAKHTLKDATVKLDGPIFGLPGGSARAAVGAGFRSEAMDGLTSAGPAGDTSVAPYASSGSRDDRSVFGELFLPFVGTANQMPGVKRLEVSVAARYDRYSDVGGTTNPKIGANWTVADGFKFRLSAGRSFHAPSLADAPSAIDTRVIRFACVPGAFIGCGSAGPADYSVLLAGGNKLKPEKANTYNIGLDLGPELLGGAKASLTWFRVDYKDVITFPTFAPVTNPLAAYDQYRVIRPAGATDAQWAAIVGPLLQGFRHDGLIYPDDRVPTAVYDLRRQNFADEKIQGLDYSIDYKLRSALGQWTFGLAGTHVLKFEQNVPGVSAPIVLLGTGYAVRNKVRAQVGWSSGDLAASLFANHVGGYRNEGVQPVQNVASFNTIDGHLAWTLKDDPVMKDVTFALDVSNLFDRNPPTYYYSSGSIVGFDPTTANPLGRVISVSLSKRW